MLGSHGVFLKDVFREVFYSPKNKECSMYPEPQRCHFRSPEERTERVETVKRDSKGW